MNRFSIYEDVKNAIARMLWNNVQPVQHCDVTLEFTMNVNVIIIACIVYTASVCVLYRRRMTCTVPDDVFSDIGYDDDPTEVECTESLSGDYDSDDSYYPSTNYPSTDNSYYPPTNYPSTDDSYYPPTIYLSTDDDSDYD